MKHMVGGSPFPLTILNGTPSEHQQGRFQLVPRPAQPQQRQELQAQAAEAGPVQAQHPPEREQAPTAAQALAQPELQEHCSQLAKAPGSKAQPSRQEALVAEERLLADQKQPSQ